ncbi:MAG: hypothetical protein JJW03_02755 [Desulfosarcina sp.]|nr:hypothetical protein [Desulfobacterales bacterium]
MMSDKWILLLLEDGVFHEESLYYAINLAKRIDCSISVLMLVANKARGSGSLNNEQKIAKKIINVIKAEKINTQSKIKYGDKASEFLKHIAGSPSFAATVWGGKKEFAGGRNKTKKKHWFSKIKTNILCPVVRPGIKEKYKK